MSARSNVYDVVCSDCGAETAVVEEYIPATRHDPAEGQTSPEECPGCGKPFDQDDRWVEAEPPEPEPREYEMGWR